MAEGIDGEAAGRGNTLFHGAIIKIRLLRWIVIAALFLPFEALAQRADENAATSAEDAFGSSIGNESVGLYNPYEARGFSPVDAGNVRIEGLYFDQQDQLTSRIVESSRVRVGLTTLGFLFPAPTGIADYSLRKAGSERIVSVVAGAGQYGAPYIEVDAKFPIMGERLGFAAGVSREHEENFDGTDGDNVSFGATLRYAPRDGIEIIPFFGRFEFWNNESSPLIITGGDYIPPPAPRRHFFSQEWADNKGYSQNHGIVAKTMFGHWQFQTGLFQSRFVRERGFSELLLNVTPAGIGDRIIVARQNQRFASTSGEVRVSYAMTENNRRHTFFAALRGRDVNSHFGGADVVSLGRGAISISDQKPRPTFTYGPLNTDAVEQKTAGLGYQGIWAGVGECNAGLQRTDYRKTNIQQLPTPLRSMRRDKPWLWNASLAAFLTKNIAVYAGYTRGLEESGSAPADAANRFAALPAIRTQQTEAGARLGLWGDMKLVAGVFDVRKPYFALDSAKVYRELGEVRHRGAEFSLTGEPAKGLNILFGMVLMRPRVTGDPVDRGEIGRKPVGQTPLTIRANADYSLPFFEDASVDAYIQTIGKRIGSVDNKAVVPGRAVVDLGARYGFNVGDNHATLRFVVANITDKFGYRVLGDHAFQFNNARHVRAYVAADF